MRTMVLAGVLLLSGCAAYVPLAELERQAMLSGDWSEVERRERALARRTARNGPDCPIGMISYCEGITSGMRCQCVQGGGSIADILAFGH